MGVPGLFRTIIQNYNKTYFWDDNFKIDYFYWDFNGIIYELYNAIKSKYNSPSMTNSKFENLLIKTIIEYVKDFLKRFKVNKELYIAIDGPPPRAKMVQQRWRRYKTEIENKYKEAIYKEFGETKPKGWDTRRISPGTKFMDKLSTQLKKVINSNELVNYPGLKITLSDASVPGEGEHKFIPIIRQSKYEKDDNIVILSKDADLLILALTTQTPNLFILRPLIDEDYLQKYLEIGYVYVNIDEYINAFTTELGFNPKSKLERFRYIYDYIFLASLGGNDFIIPAKFLKIKSGGLDILLKTYKKIAATQQNFLVLYNPQNKNKSTVKPRINTYFFKELIRELASMEQYQMKNLRTKQVKQSSRLSNNTKLKEQNKSELEVVISRFDNLDFNSQYHPFREDFVSTFKKVEYTEPMAAWKPKYYQHFFNIDTQNKQEFNEMRKLISVKYLESLIFTIEYYLIGVPSWSFYYPFRNAPLLNDFYFNIKFMSDINDIFIPVGEPVKPFTQLMMIYPVQLKTELPVLYRPVMTDLKYGCVQFYPKDFELDVLIGDKFIYSEPILPNIDQKKLVGVLKQLEDNLPAADKKRNKITNDVLTVISK